VDCRSDEERKKIPGEQLVNKDHPQVIEIWNNVFIQYNRKKDGSLEPLPSTHVDTGMGLERLVRVLQGKTSNYDTDIFSGTIQQVEVITGKKYDSSDTREAVAFRVLADHIRAISFTIADGQLPSNTGAGYVIRRILRRAVRYYYSYLGYKQPLLAQLVPLLANQFENVFPELQQQVDFVTRVVREEEEAFLRTLEKGLRRIEELISASAGMIAGAAAFELYDTYGFPIDLTRLIASEKGLTVDEKGFEDEMKKQKDRSRAATAVDAADWVVVQEGANQFVGYDSLETNTNVLKYRKVTAKGKEAYQWILEKTPFYAESGGQVGDKGWLKFADESIEVIDTKKDNDLIVHVTAAMPATVSATVTASVNPDNRLETTLHHSATHLLHAALRQVLGAHVAQKGSMVHAANLRFDFSHFAKMSEEEILQVEAIVNEKIRANIPVVIQSMSKDEALKLGAMALFGEKYGDVVRVVIMDPTYSVELCGGTHVGATGQLGYFKITGETAVAAGVRRVEACCGKQAEVYLQEQFQLLDSIKQTLKNPKELLRAIEQLQSDNTELKKQLEVLETRQLRELSKTLVQEIETVNGISFLGKQIAVDNPEALKKICTELKALHADHVAVLTALIQEKSFVAVSVSESIVQSKGLDAGKVIKEKIAPLIKGGGGGQKTLATAGGQLVDQLPAVIAAVKSLL
jgi:alanyl-tRNA synthetase